MYRAIINKWIIGLVGLMLFYACEPSPVPQPYEEDPMFSAAVQLGNSNLKWVLGDNAEAKMETEYIDSVRVWKSTTELVMTDNQLQLPKLIVEYYSKETNKEFQYLSPNEFWDQGQYPLYYRFVDTLKYLEAIPRMYPEQAASWSFNSEVLQYKVDNNDKLSIPFNDFGLQPIEICADGVTNQGCADSYCRILKPNQTAWVNIQYTVVGNAVSASASISNAENAVFEWDLNGQTSLTGKNIQWNLSPNELDDEKTICVTAYLPSGEQVTECVNFIPSSSDCNAFIELSQKNILEFVESDFPGSFVVTYIDVDGFSYSTQLGNRGNDNIQIKRIEEYTGVDAENTTAIVELQLPFVVIQTKNGELQFNGNTVSVPMEYPKYTE